VYVGRMSRACVVFLRRRLLVPGRQLVADVEQLRSGLLWHDRGCVLLLVEQLLGRVHCGCSRELLRRGEPDPERDRLHLRILLSWRHRTACAVHGGARIVMWQWQCRRGRRRVRPGCVLHGGQRPRTAMHRGRWTFLRRRVDLWRGSAVYDRFILHRGHRGAIALHLPCGALL
jgi:hypothetical protein